MKHVEDVFGGVVKRYIISYWFLIILRHEVDM